MQPSPSSTRRVRPIADSRSFTLVELLVVILIIGILAGIALPAFLNQRAKAQDTEAKTALRTAVTAIAVYHMETQSFAATAAQLQAIEPSLLDTNNLQVAGTATTYVISEDSTTGTTFTLSRDAAGLTTRDCSVPGLGLCQDNLDAGGNRW